MIKSEICSALFSHLARVPLYARSIRVPLMWQPVDLQRTADAVTRVRWIVRRSEGDIRRLNGIWSGALLLSLGTVSATSVSPRYLVWGIWRLYGAARCAGYVCLFLRSPLLSLYDKKSKKLHSSQSYNSMLSWDRAGTKNKASNDLHSLTM